MKKIICLLFILALLIALPSCMRKPSGSGASAGTQAPAEQQTAAATGAAGTSEPETTKPPQQIAAKAIDRNFTIPPAEGYYFTYLYVQFVSSEGFAGYGSFSDGVFIVYPGADQIFHIFDTVCVTFDGKDIAVESRTHQAEFGEVTTAQTVSKVYEAHRSDYEAGEPVFDKPVIYLYPTEPTVCSVRLEFNGRLLCTYPEYGEGGWRNFTAYPDGTLIFPDGGEYYALFWEGKGKAEYDTSKGFCVKGSETARFLSEILPKLGLNAKEANEFIIYWLPRMQNNEYNLISFQTEAYEKSAALTVEPAPDTVIRVFMTYKPLTQAVDIEPQTVTAPARTGFTVIEWGGSEIN